MKGDLDEKSKILDIRSWSVRTYICQLSEK